MLELAPIPVKRPSRFPPKERISTTAPIFPLSSPEGGEGDGGSVEGLLPKATARGHLGRSALDCSKTHRILCDHPPLGRCGREARAPFYLGNTPSRYSRAKAGSKTIAI